MKRRLEKQLVFNFMEEEPLLKRAGRFYASLPEKISNISIKKDILFLKLKSLLSMQHGNFIFFGGLS